MKSAFGKFSPVAIALAIVKKKKKIIINKGSAMATWIGAWFLKAAFSESKIPIKL